MHRIGLALIVLIVLGACASAPAPTSTPPPTLIPLAAIDLSAALLQSGDLPAAFTAGAYAGSAPLSVDNFCVQAHEPVLWRCGDWSMQTNISGC